MRCLFDHNWGWPRRRGDRDIQVCIDCGAERESKVTFDGPRYTLTQEAIPNFSVVAAEGSGAKLKRGVRTGKVRPIRSVA